MYALKQLPEDFIVRERSTVEVKEKGKYNYFKLIKKNRNTLDVITEIAKQLHLPEKEIGFAGNKDKRAVTEQIISVKGIPKEKVSTINLENITLEFLSYGDIPISLGDLEGNYFEIVVRNLERFNLAKIDYVENYFDEQRFGRNNVEIGRSIIKKKFEEAVKLIDKDSCNKYVTAHKKDYIGALKLLPLRLLRIYVNAYQSCLWNETLAEYLKLKGEVTKEINYSLGKLIFIKEDKKLINLKIPLIGFGSAELIDDTEINTIVITIMEREKINYPDFIIKQIPELSVEGELRSAFVEAGDLLVQKAENDELNSGKKKIKITFSLPKGSYATMVIRKIVQEEDI